MFIYCLIKTNNSQRNETCPMVSFFFKIYKFILKLSYPYIYFIILSLSLQTNIFFLQNIHFFLFFFQSNHSTLGDYELSFIIYFSLFSIRLSLSHDRNHEFTG